MRRTTLFHGVLSFFFNTVFIAMAVNAAVSLASQEAIKAMALMAG